MFSKLMRRLRALFKRSELDRELDEELRFHLERETEENIRKGMTPKEARRRAILRFGGVQQIKEECRDARGVSLIETIARDLRYGVRVLRARPGFTAVVVLSLGLGIGANTAIFSIIDTVLLKKLPVEEPDRLVFLHRKLPSGRADDSFPYRTFEQLRDHNRTLAGVFAFDDTRLSATIGGQAEFLHADFVSGNYFSVLGVTATRGRTFNADDDQPGKPPVAVISYDFWKRRFALDPGVVGKTFDLKGVPVTIIGITPLEFFGRSVVGPGPEVSVPLVLQPQFALKDHDTFGVMARLKPGVTVEQASADLNLNYQRAIAEVTGSAPTEQARAEMLAQSVILVPGEKGESDLRAGLSYSLGLLMAIVGLVLLITCANVANLQLARAMARQREIAIRLAIGAGRRRLVQQLLTESVLLALMGGALGLLLAFWGSGLLSALLFTGRSSAPLELQLDWRVFGFTAAVSLLTGLLFGLAPALRATRVELNHALKDKTLHRGGTKRQLRPGKVLVVAQVALSLFLLIGAGLFVRSFQKLNEVSTGFDKENVLLFWVFPSLSGYDGPRELYLYREMQERIGALPGVRSASLSRLRLFSGGRFERDIRIEGQADEPEGASKVSFNAVGPKFFETMGVPLLQGRDFTVADRENSPKVVVISQSAARRYFRGENPLGRHIGFGARTGADDVEVVGVVGDIKTRSLRGGDEVSAVYVPFTQAPPDMLGQMTFEVRTTNSTTAIVEALRRAMQEMDGNLPMVGVETQAAQIDQSLGNERSLATLSALFGLLAVSLTSIGLYGTISYTVVRRTNEIGIRMALGARRGHVLRLIIGQGVGLVLAGVVVAIGAALPTTRLIAGVLYGVSAVDPPTYAGAVILLGLIAFVACLIPAWRATRVDPQVALRYE